MSRKVLAALLAFICATAAGAQSPTAAAGAWWHALTVGDTAYLRAHSASRLSLTLSGGETFDRASMLGKAANHKPGPTLYIRQLDSSVVHSTAGTAVVANRVMEGSQGGENVYRFLTVLERSGAEWRVTVAQSTREIGLTPRISSMAAGALDDYAGSYRAQNGGVLRIIKRDSVLAVVDPSGGEARIEPIGVGLFELPILYDGIAVVRYVFMRDSSGRVASLSRLIYGTVKTWPRVP